MKQKNLLVKTTLLSYVNCEENGVIEVQPLYNELKRGETLTQSGVAVSYRGRVHVNANGDIAIKPYNERKRKRSVKLYCSEHCTIRMHADGRVTEHWKFEFVANAAMLAKMRQRELNKVNMFYHKLAEVTPFIVPEC